MRKNKSDSTNTMEDVAKAFLIISCGVAVFLLIDCILFWSIGTFRTIYLVGVILCVTYLLWSIPMTIIYFRKINKGEQIPLIYKICATIFVNPVSGILMLIDNKEIKENL